MFGFIGIGQCGGSIADESVKRGFHAAAINYSSSDLNSLENIEEKLHLVGSEGVGKDRTAASEYMKNNWEASIEFIKNTMEKPSIQVIFVVFSAAGGTGSGISPILIELLNEYLPHKTIVAVPVLPDDGEVVLNQLNAIETLQELSKLEVCVLPLDNQKVAQKLNKTVSEGRLYKETNTEFLNLLEDLINYTERSSKVSTLDKKDLNQLFNTSGIMTISSADLNDYVDGGKYFNKLHEDIQKSWQQTIFSVDDFENVLRAGIILDVEDTLAEHISYKRLFDKDYGMPLDLFKGLYNEEGSRMISILAGLGWINSRMKRIDDLIEKGNKEIPQKEVYQPKTRSRHDILMKSRVSESKTGDKKKSYIDALKKLKR
ncbi:Tubulin-like protein CetZ [Bacillus licheniformis]|uniref:tubulin-like doman-containing protein n=1 Tax=Bacillus licheniformis TaxID=1402 RepID=UPI0011A5CCD5|nr:tubulin-like doman-containing protein [Bacillus licheniformis]TWL55437.1 Tubulin-like protein CetZ [Bacillus licheniformis]